MLKLNDVELEFTEGALKAVAQKSIALKTGARGLRAIVEKIMLDVMYDIPSDKSVTSVTVTEDCVNKNAPPVIARKRKETA